MLKTYMIGYDLNRPGQGYTELINAIKSYGTWWHSLDSTWLIRTTKTAAEIRDSLLPHLDKNDELLVALIGQADAAWAGMNPESSEWLLAQLS